MPRPGRSDSAAPPAAERAPTSGGASAANLTQIHKQKWFSIFILVLPCFSCGLTIKFVKKDLRLACQRLDPNIQTSSEDRPFSNYSAFQSSVKENVTESALSTS
ncbi:unnamed protein product [Coccothraustes coccothraustes]